MLVTSAASRGSRAWPAGLMPPLSAIALFNQHS